MGAPSPRSFFIADFCPGDSFTMLQFYRSFTRDVKSKKGIRIKALRRPFFKTLEKIY
jgi:hypothetical protein